jgi:hypothetical protein
MIVKADAALFFARIIFFIAVGCTPNGEVVPLFLWLSGAEKSG